MEDLFKKIKKVRDNVSLNSLEQEAMDDFVISFVDSTKSSNEKNMEEKKNNFFNFKKKFVFSTLSLVILISGAGTAYASNESLPGDLLYPIKVNVIEELKGAFKLNAEQKINWNIERMNKRISEIETIEQKNGTLDEKSVMTAQAEIQKYTQDIIQKIQGIKDAHELEDVLKYHIEKLQEVATKIDDKISYLSATEDKIEIKSLEKIKANIIDTTTQTNQTKYQNYQELFNSGALTSPNNYDGDYNENTHHDLRVISPIPETTMYIGEPQTIIIDKIPSGNIYSYEVRLHSATLGGGDLGYIYMDINTQQNPNLGDKKIISWKVGNYNDPFKNYAEYTAEPGKYSIDIKVRTWDNQYYFASVDDITLLNRYNPTQDVEEKNGALSVKVMDQTGANANYGTTLTLKNQQTNEIFYSQAGSGSYVTISDVPAGYYDVQVITPDQYYNANFSISIIAGRINSKTITVGSKDNSLSQNYDDLDDYVSPTIHITMEDVAPDNIFASDFPGRSVLFARGTMKADEAVRFDRLRLVCSGDSRALNGATLTTSNDAIGNMIITPTYGGFNLEISRQQVNFTVNRDEEVTISLFLDIQNVDTALKNGAEYPRKISCGTQTATFASIRTGRPVPPSYLKITNWLTAINTLKTTINQ